MNKRVLVGLSGGVDSTWACKKLLEAGYDVEGVLLSLHNSAPVKEAEKSAEKLGIKLHIADFQKDFEKTVKSYFTEEYCSGRTPNPCVICNREIKFRKLIDFADSLGIKHIATGHYVEVKKNDETGRFEIIAGCDLSKDQSYFLWRLTQEELSRFITPMGDENKEEIIKKSIGEGLFDDVGESQEICFIPDNDHIAFIKENASEEMMKKAFTEGDFVDLNGNVLGRHKGIANYTAGQRKGLGIALGKPAFVIEINAEKNQVVLGFEEDNRCREIDICDMNFVSLNGDGFEGESLVRLRHRGKLEPCCVKASNGVGKITFSDKVKNVSKGQSAVFYDEKGRVLFGGIINSVIH